MATEGRTMTEALQPDTLGPVDVAVILFEGGAFNGDVAPAIADLHDQGVVRVIDLAFVTKDADGTTAVVEVEEAAAAEAFERINGDPLDLLSDEDLNEAAAGLEPGSAALVIVWENLWAARLARSIRESKGRLITLERIPHENVLRAIAALDGE
jgi:uncharacterized membrane protein